MKRKFKDLDFVKIGDKILEKLGWEGFAKAHLFVDPKAEKGESGYVEDKKAYRFPIAVLGENEKLIFFEEAIISVKDEIEKNTDFSDEEKQEILKTVESMEIVKLETIEFPEESPEVAGTDENDPNEVDKETQTETVKTSLFATNCPIPVKELSSKENTVDVQLAKVGEYEYSKAISKESMKLDLFIEKDGKNFLKITEDFLSQMVENWKKFKTGEIVLSNAVGLPLEKMFIWLEHENERDGSYSEIEDVYLSKDVLFGKIKKTDRLEKAVKLGFKRFSIEFGKLTKKIKDKIETVFPFFFGAVLTKYPLVNDIEPIKLSASGQYMIIYGNQKQGDKPIMLSTTEYAEYQELKGKIIQHQIEKLSKPNKNGFAFPKTVIEMLSNFMNDKKTDDGKFYLSKESAVFDEKEAMKTIFDELHKIGMVPMSDLDPRESDAYEYQYNLSNDAKIKLSKDEIEHCEKNGIKKTSEYLEKLKKLYSELSNTQKQMSFEEYRQTDWQIILQKLGVNYGK